MEYGRRCISGPPVQYENAGGDIKKGNGGEYETDQPEEATTTMVALAVILASVMVIPMGENSRLRLLGLS